MTQKEISALIIIPIAIFIITMIILHPPADNSNVPEQTGTNGETGIDTDTGFEIEFHEMTATELDTNINW